jgi:hypothetical protein
MSKSCTLIDLRTLLIEQYGDLLKGQEAFFASEHQLIILQRSIQQGEIKFPRVCSECDQPWWYSSHIATCPHCEGVGQEYLQSLEDISFEPED